MITPMQVMRATVTEDVEVCIDFVSKTLTELLYMPRGDLPYQEPISMCLPVPLTHTESLLLIAVLESWGWENVHVTSDGYIVNMYFPKGYSNDNHPRP